MIVWNELTEDDRSIEATCTEADAIQTMRKWFKQVRPGKDDPRSDQECIDDFMAVHWAWQAKEETHGD